MQQCNTASTPAGGYTTLGSTQDQSPINVTIMVGERTVAGTERAQRKTTRLTQRKGKMREGTERHGMKGHGKKSTQKCTAKKGPENTW
jgi:hypothetical protein